MSKERAFNSYSVCNLTSKHILLEESRIVVSGIGFRLHKYISIPKNKRFPLSPSLPCCSSLWHRTDTDTQAYWVVRKPLKRRYYFITFHFKVSNLTARRCGFFCVRLWLDSRFKSMQPARMRMDHQWSSVRGKLCSASVAFQMKCKKTFLWTPCAVERLSINDRINTYTIQQGSKKSFWKSIFWKKILGWWFSFFLLF